jgi:predicted nucleic acid-binding protein
VAEKIPAYVLDSFALLAYFQAEASGPAVRTLFESARDKRAALHFSLINAGEMYYIVHREQGEERAEEMLKDLRTLPIALDLASEERILAAARIKAQYPISDADAFAVALAQELSAKVVTGDPEFKNVAEFVDVMWLTQN